MKKADRLVAKGTGGPLFRQIAQNLTDAIEAGRLRVGTHLPTEMELMQRFGVSRHTVRQAIGSLRAEGLITSQPGVGTTVIRRRPAGSYSESYSSIEDLVQFAKGQPIDIYDIRDVVADDELAVALRAPPGQEFLRILGRRSRKRGGQSEHVCHVAVYVDARFAGIRDTLHRRKSTIGQSVEEMYGFRVARIEQEIEATVLIDEIAASLNVEAGFPALLIRRWYYGPDDRVFLRALNHYPMGRFVYRTELVRKVEK